jgi:hypothetical protein
MLDFRKVLLALSVAGLGLVGTASAQVPQCTAAVAPFEGYVAVEGLTEVLPPIQITCNNGVMPTPGNAVFSGPVTFVLSTSAPVTNQTLTAAPNNLDISATDGTVADAAAATITLSGPSSVTVYFPSVTAGTTVFTISGIRINATMSAVASTITVTVTSPSVQVSATAINAAFVSKSIGSLSITPSANNNACTLTTDAGNTPATVPVTAVATVTLTSGFIDALKTKVDVSDQTAIGSNNPAAINGFPDPNSVTAKQGTVIALTFSNLNAAGVNYYVPAVVMGPGLTLTSVTSSTGGTNSTAVTPGTPAFGTNLAALTLSGTSATAYYQVTTSSASETSGGIVLYEVVPSVANVTTYSTTPITVSAVLDGTAAPGYPQYNTSQTAYTASFPTPIASGTSGLLSPCGTTLLFPYVTQAGGYDTGIAITNASTGSGIPGVVTNNGSCVVTFYGSPAVTTPYTTGPITAGTDTAFLLSAATNSAMTSGYAVAVCNFLGAHGYAFIFDNAGTPSFSTADYLAIVTSSGATATLPFPTN